MRTANRTIFAGMVLSLSVVLGMLVSTAGAAQPAKRTPQQIMADLTVASGELRGVFGSPDAILDEAKRAEIAPKAVPPMRRMLGLLDELLAAEPMAKVHLGMTRMQVVALLSLMGDADAAARLEEGAKSSNAADATLAKGTQLLVRWWKAAKDAPAQGQVVDELQAMVKASPESSELASVVVLMYQRGAANDELKGRMEKIILDELKSETAQEVAEEIRAEQKLKSLEGKELVIEGTKLDGTKFSTADWKGKVVLVDFWATWCGPCIGELPRVTKAYADYHDKGLEIVGVSCDRAEQDLVTFLATRKDMPWPQLFDKANPGWHPLAKQYGVNGIPTMFLIDKKGVVRSVTARENFEQMISKLLEEK